MLNFTKYVDPSCNDGEVIVPVGAIPTRRLIEIPAAFFRVVDDVITGKLDTRRAEVIIADVCHLDSAEDVSILSGPPVWVRFNEKYEVEMTRTASALAMANAPTC